ncbi:putative DNA repair and recombination protein radB [Corchorus capsularis]|uniref:Putative DNA repair and recombination protein radB n=1 Tax=Corchorus capsularis TaxID=210143 RepID=A0A1R3HN40_COCAP|nr:putative DNA repair and recombination protein radB [Corchorus capsularis]
MVEIAVDGSKRRLSEISIGIDERETWERSKNGEKRRKQKKGATHGPTESIRKEKRNAATAASVSGAGKVTNHTVGGEGGTFKLALGEGWKSIPHTWLLLSRDRTSNACNITILKHSSKASGKATSSLWSDGVWRWWRWWRRRRGSGHEAALDVNRSTTFTRQNQQHGFPSVDSYPLNFSSSAEDHDHRIVINLNFGDPFSTMRDPFLHELNVTANSTTYFGSSPNSTIDI